MPRDFRAIWIIASAIWAMAVIVGFFYLTKYESLAGDRSAGPRDWPTTGEIARDSGTATLIVAIHPHCPCSRATIEELARVLPGIRAGVRVEVLIWQPLGAKDDWVHTTLWEQAERLPGAMLIVDEDGVAIRRFGAMTSGHVLLYSSDGRLLFSGGVTASRGHEGGNPSLDALRRRLRGDLSDYVETPVFGCPFSDSPRRLSSEIK